MATPAYDWDLVGRLFGRLVFATCALVIGLTLIYAFGAGYFGYFAVPTPGNYVVSLTLLVVLLNALRKFVSRP